MPECHKCPFNGKGSDQCISCRYPANRQPSNHGHSLVPIQYVPETRFRLPEYAEFDPKYHALASFMRLWLSLPTVSRNMLTKVFVNETICRNDIAASHRISVQAVNQRLLRLARKHPAIKEILSPHFRALRKPRINAKTKGGKRIHAEPW